MTNKMPDILKEELNLKLDKFWAAAAAKEISLPDDQQFVESLKTAFCFSDFIAESCARDPDMLKNLIESGDLYRVYSEREYQQNLQGLIGDASDETELAAALRRFRNREMARIAWRELADWSEFEEIFRDLTALAEVCIDLTFSKLYDWHCQKYGKPLNDRGEIQNIVVLGMGKLGAGELNFSSDIDLIFAYPEMGSTSGADQSVSAEEFFITLCRRFLKVFGLKGVEGILFRVDMRLRPFGESGPLAMSFNALEEYYQRHGSEWERYALIKAKVVAGDKAEGEKLLERLQPFIYRRYLDYGVYESLREMKQKISREVERKGLQDNIKIGAGGIREVEFFGQIFQLARGGVENQLRERPILTILKTLADEGYIPQETYAELTEAYYFLRRTENRLQEFRDQQVHTLPTDKLQRLSLALSMDFENWEAFKSRLEAHTNCVHKHFNGLLVKKSESAAGEDKGGELSAVWLGQSERESEERLLSDAGYSSPTEIIRLIQSLREDHATLSLSSKGRSRLDRLMPQVLMKVGGANEPELVFKRIVDLIRTIERRTTYIALMLENPDVLDHLIKLVQASPWITKFLSQHPVLLDELIDPMALGVPPEKEKSAEQLRQRLQQVTDEDPEQQLDELIIFKNVNVLHVAAADISGMYPLMKVSDYLTEIAETVLTEVYELSWDYVVGKFGRPATRLIDAACDQGFAVAAYGKLGGIELSYGSDLDLVFLHTGVNEPTTGAANPIDSPQFFTRLGQRIVHLLTTHTRAGRLYEIDMRLRPSGNAGILVSNAESFREYQLNEAWTWEHQAIIKARVICGDPAVTDFFDQTRREVLIKTRDPSMLKEEIKSMRDRMFNEKNSAGAGQFDLKKSRGGIIDIEFLVQYLTLLHAGRHDSLCQWTDNVRLIETLDKIGVLDNHNADFLRETYLIFRSEVHKLNLQEKPAIVSGDDFIFLQNRIKEIWDSFFD